MYTSFKKISIAFTLSYFTLIFQGTISNGSESEALVSADWDLDDVDLNLEIYDSEKYGKYVQKSDLQKQGIHPLSLSSIFDAKMKVLIPYYEGYPVLGRAAFFADDIESASHLSGVDRAFFVGLSEDPIFKDYSDDEFFKTFDERYFHLPIKGATIEVAETLSQTAFTLKSNPYLAKTFNSSLLFHGANSASLLTFTQYAQGDNNLLPSGSLLKKGKVPFSGQILWHHKDNKKHLSTAIIYHLDSVLSYAGIRRENYSWTIGNGWNPKNAEQKLLEIANLYQKTTHIFYKNYRLVHERRLSEWKKLTKREQELVELNFPVIYGLRPSHPNSYDQLANSLVKGEIVVKNGAANQDIKVIYVPEQFIQETKDILSKTAAHVKVASLEKLLEDFTEKS